MFDIEYFVSLKQKLCCPKLVSGFKCFLNLVSPINSVTPHSPTVRDVVVSRRLKSVLYKT